MVKLAGKPVRREFAKSKKEILEEYRYGHYGRVRAARHRPIPRWLFESKKEKED